MKAKEITALVGYYDTAMCNLQNELSATHTRIETLTSDLARKEVEKMTEANWRTGPELINQQISKQFDELSDKYAKLEQLHAAAIAGFRSDTEILQTELDKGKEEARSAQQEVAYFKHALDDALSSLACVTVDAVAHCNVEHAESFRTFAGLVKEHVVLSIQDRVQLDTMLANLGDEF